MVTDRRIIVSNGNTSLDITGPPYYVTKTEGFDTLDVQIVTSQGFDQDGADEVNKIVQPRDMKIVGRFKADSTVQMQDIHDKLLQLFIAKKTITITHYYGGKNRVIKASVTKTPRFDFTEVSTVQEYSVQLQAADPYWSDPTETFVQMANITGGFHFPITVPKDTGMVFGVKSASLIADVFNKSSINVGMKIVFIAKGTVVNPQIFDVNTRKFLKINCEMIAGETITVTTGNDKTVTRNKQGIESDYIGKVDLAGGGNSFLELAPGDNLLRYAAEAGEDMLEIKIMFWNKYQGV